MNIRLKIKNYNPKSRKIIFRGETGDYILCDSKIGSSTKKKRKQFQFSKKNNIIAA